MTGKKTEESHHLATVLNAVGDDYIDLLKDYIFQKCESIKNFLEDLKDDEFRKRRITVLRRCCRRRTHEFTHSP